MSNLKNCWKLFIFNKKIQISEQIFNGKVLENRENVENSVESVYKRRSFAEYFLVDKFVTF